MTGASPGPGVPSIRSVGLPAETKDGERRVALDPAGVAALVDAGLSVLVEAGAGSEAGFPDHAYLAVGARVTADATEAWGSDAVVKVKEPQPAEYRHFRPGLVLFAYLHLAACPDLARALCDYRVTAYAYETLEERGRLPLLACMSEIAGRAAVLVGATEVGRARGRLLGGAGGVPPARVVVVGLGVAGTMAARGCRGLDADVTGVDVDQDRLRDAVRAGDVGSTLVPSTLHLSELLVGADLVVGAALVPGARAPIVVSREHVRLMPRGSVVVDLSIDQGGCVETASPTTLSDPTYEVDGVVHYCVTNVPGQFPATASRALSAAVAPRLVRSLRSGGPGLPGALNVREGAVVHPTVATALEPVA